MTLRVLCALLALGRAAGIEMELGTAELPHDHHEVRWIKSFDNLAHLSHEASDHHPVVFLFSDPTVSIESRPFELEVLKDVARDKTSEGALFAVTNNVTVTKEFWPGGLPDPPRIIVLRAFEEEQRLEAPFTTFQKSGGGTAAKLSEWINANAFHRFHEVTEYNVDLLHRRDPPIKCVWYGPTQSQQFKKSTTDIIRKLADKYSKQIMFMYVDHKQKQLIERAGGPLDEETPCMRMFVTGNDGGIGNVIRSHPENDKHRQTVISQREMVHRDFAPKFIGNFVEESYNSLSGSGDIKSEL